MSPPKIPQLPAKRVTYALLTAGLFAVEVVIAIFAADTFVRAYLGDVLVIALIYCLLQSLLRKAPAPVILGVLAFACAIEVGQYFDFAAQLGLGQNQLASIVLGRTFSWPDFLAYFAGALAVGLAEAWRGEPSV